MSPDKGSHLQTERALPFLLAQSGTQMADWYCKRLDLCSLGYPMTHVPTHTDTVEAKGGLYPTWRTMGDLGETGSAIS